MIEHKEVEAPPAVNGAASPNEQKRLPAPPEVKALPAPPKRNRWSGILWLLIFAGLGYAGYRYYQGAEQKKSAAEAAQAAKQAHRATTVSATAARSGDLPIFLRGLGTVTAYNTVNVKARVDGPLVKVNFTEGQNVNKGDVLVEIDPRTFQVAVDQAQGQLARDQAQLKDAQVNLARYQKLYDEGVIAKQQLDTQASMVGQFDGAISVDQANIDNAKLNLSFAKVTAPISGRIGLRQVDVGNIVHASDQNPMAVITQLQPISVVFTIPADSLPSLMARVHTGVRLPVDAYDRADRDKIASGVFLTVDNQIDTTTGTSRLKATFENTDNVLFPNQFVNCRLLLDTKHGVTLVPAPAVQRGPQGSYVYLVKSDKTVTMRPVTLGTTEGNDVEITKGLVPGDVVVTDGQDKLQDGGNVDVAPEPGQRTNGQTPGNNTQAPGTPRRGKK